MQPTDKSMYYDVLISRCFPCKQTCKQ